MILKYQKKPRLPFPTVYVESLALPMGDTGSLDGLTLCFSNNFWTKPFTNVYCTRKMIE
jgi:hypothetical protein